MISRTLNRNRSNIKKIEDYSTKKKIEILSKVILRLSNNHYEDKKIIDNNSKMHSIGFIGKKSEKSEFLKKYPDDLLKYLLKGWKTYEILEKFPDSSLYKFPDKKRYDYINNEIIESKTIEIKQKVPGSKRKFKKQYPIVRLHQNQKTWRLIYNFLRKSSNVYVLTEFLLSIYSQKVNPKAFKNYRKHFQMLELLTNYLDQKISNDSKPLKKQTESTFMLINEIKEDLEKKELFYIGFECFQECKHQKGLKKQLLKAKPSERIKILEKAIEKQKRLISSLHEFVKLNAVFNICDEKYKLMQFEYILESLKTKGFELSKNNATSGINSFMAESLTQNTTFSRHFQVDEYYKEKKGLIYHE